MALFNTNGAMVESPSSAFTQYSSPSSNYGSLYSFGKSSPTLGQMFIDNATASPIDTSGFNSIFNYGQGPSTNTSWLDKLGGDNGILGNVGSILGPVANIGAAALDYFQGRDMLDLEKKNLEFQKAAYLNQANNAIQLAQNRAGKQAATRASDLRRARGDNTLMTDAEIAAAEQRGKEQSGLTKMVA